MGEVVPAHTSPTLHPPIPSHCASIVATSTLRVIIVLFLLHEKKNKNPSSNQENVMAKEKV